MSLAMAALDAKSRARGDLERAAAKADAVALADAQRMVLELSRGRAFSGHVFYRTQCRSLHVSCPALNGEWGC